MKTFEEYMEASKKLMSMLFEEDVVNKLNNTKLKEIEWDGLDIIVPDITVILPTIKQRFSAEWVEYYKDRDITAIDLFLQSVFHYGYQQGINESKNKLDSTKLFEMLVNEKGNSQ